MSSEARGRHELFRTPFVGADIIPLRRVRSFDVLLQMLLFYIVLVAAGVWTTKRALVIMGSQVSGKASWAVEGLGAAGVCAFDRLEVRRPPRSRAERRKRSVYRICGREFGISGLVVRHIAVQLKVEVEALSETGESVKSAPLW